MYHVKGLWKNTNKNNNTKTKREKVETDKRKRRRKRRKKKKEKKKARWVPRVHGFFNWVTTNFPHDSCHLLRPLPHRRSSSTPPLDWVRSACSSSFFCFFFLIQLYCKKWILFCVWIIWDVFWEWSKVRSACSSQQLCFFLFLFIFFFFLRFRFKGNREKRSDHGSQNRAVEPRFERLPAFLALTGS